jgi:voltage-gated potassium channel
MTAYSRWKFTVLFGCLLLAAVIHPFVVTHVDGKAAFVVAMTFFFSAAILSFTKNRWQKAVGVFLGILAIASRWWDLFSKGEKGMYLEIGGKVVEIAFLTLTVIMLMIAIFKRRETTFDSIFGAFAGYLIIAILWGLCFSIIEFLYPGAFNVNESLRKEWASSKDHREWLLSYFSCCTLMTVGYGDITPLRPIARTLSVLEAMTGQLYLAVLVAALVGAKVAQMSSPPDKSESAS